MGFHQCLIFLRSLDPVHDEKYNPLEPKQACFWRKNSLYQDSLLIGIHKIMPSSMDIQPFEGQAGILDKNY